MHKRNFDTAPKDKEQVKYVVVKGALGVKVAEDLFYVLEKEMSIDTPYYLEKDIMQAMLKILQSIIRMLMKEFFFGGSYMKLHEGGTIYTSFQG
ncbi:hypothetical protein AALP_AA3G159000 [Arabis alpina]|uniref:DNA-directed DNA polymerase n=1 Tax=Arabis alpina TaxID=50452 RepID=A0A087H9H5_ARAAL|nr:hypothetical protein AALP_AA3G159000 [Arabis alpina]